MATTPNEEEQVIIEAGVPLEGRFSFSPLNTDIGKRNAAVCLVFAHPYGPLGGNLYNNVVTHLYSHFANEGFAVLRFNFRGSGKSKGRTSWTGNAERSDMHSVVEFVKQRGWDKIVLIGYSYGSMITSSICNLYPEIIATVSISPPFSVSWFLFTFQHSAFITPLRESTKPKLFITGTNDNFTSVKRVESEVNLCCVPKRMKVVDGVDHFWFDKEGILVREIDTWLNDVVFSANSFR